MQVDPPDHTVPTPPAEGELFTQLYDELKGIARAHMSGERPHHTLQPTALVNEAFLRLISGKKTLWRDKEHFLCVASRVMRRVLIDAARSRNRLKRGGEMEVLALHGNETDEIKPLDEMLSVHEALKKMEKESPGRAKLVELRFFAGLTIDEAAKAMKISPTTAKKHWTLGRAWLFRELNR